MERAIDKYCWRTMFQSTGGNVMAQVEEIKSHILKTLSAARPTAMRKNTGLQWRGRSCLQPSTDTRATVSYFPNRKELSPTTRTINKVIAHNKAGTAGTGCSRTQSATSWADKPQQRNESIRQGSYPSISRTKIGSQHTAER